MGVRSTCTCHCHLMGGEHLHTNPCCYPDPDPANEVYEVVLRVEREPGQNHPMDWNWTELVGGSVDLIRAVDIDDSVLSINFTVDDVADMGTSDYMDDEDAEEIPRDVAIERARSVAKYIEDTARNLAGEQLFGAVTSGEI